MVEENSLLLTRMTSADSVRDLFNRIAPIYDELNDRLSFGQHHIWKKMTVKWSQAKPGDTCLDICCGSGDLTQLLAERVGPRGQVIGLDFSSEQLVVAQQRTQHQAPHAPIQWVEGDALHLPFADHTFDAITMGYGLRNVGDIPGCLREIYRVLKPNAKAAILDFHRPTNPLVRTFQQWYLDAIVVPTATNYGCTEEYAYIAPSLDRFPTGDEQKKLAQQVGFSTVVHYPIAGGTMGVLVVAK